MTILPIEAYGDLTSAQKMTIDAKILELLHTLPTEPGEYVDREGSSWTLGEDGCWVDHEGEVRSKEWTPLLALFGIGEKKEEQDGD